MPVKRNFQFLLIAVFIFSALSAAADSPPFGDGGAALQSVLDDITVGPTPGSSSIDVTQDALADANDSYWKLNASSGIVNFIAEVTVNADTNTFGIYELTNPANRVQIYAGGDGPGTQRFVKISADGSVFINFVDTGIDFPRINKYDLLTSNLKTSMS